MFDINLSILENLNFFDCDWLQYKNSCLKSGIKPFPNPRGVESQNLYDYFFIVRDITQLASTSCAKHGFSQ